MHNRLIIKEAIKRHGLSVAEVAQRMNITRVTLSTHINGNPSVEVLFRIADAIGCDVSELFEPAHKTSSSLVCPHCGRKLAVKLDAVE